MKKAEICVCVVVVFRSPFFIEKDKIPILFETKKRKGRDEGAREYILE
jgi:hypothetical protein